MVFRHINAACQTARSLIWGTASCEHRRVAQLVKDGASEAEAVLFLLPWLYVIASVVTQALADVDTNGYVIYMMLTLFLFLATNCKNGLEVIDSKKKLKASETLVMKLRSQLQIETLDLADAKQANEKLQATLTATYDEMRRVVLANEATERNSRNSSCKWQFLAIFAALPSLCPDSLIAHRWILPYLAAAVIATSLYCMISMLDRSETMCRIKCTCASAIRRSKSDDNVNNEKNDNVGHTRRRRLSDIFKEVIFYQCLSNDNNDATKSDAASVSAVLL